MLFLYILLNISADPLDVAMKPFVQLSQKNLCGPKSLCPHYKKGLLLTKRSLNGESGQESH